jgi:hypothetical protein
LKKDEEIKIEVTHKESRKLSSGGEIRNNKVFLDDFQTFMWSNDHNRLKSSTWLFRVSLNKGCGILDLWFRHNPRFQDPASYTFSNSGCSIE